MSTHLEVAGRTEGSVLARANGGRRVVTRMAAGLAAAVLGILMVAGCTGGSRRDTEEQDPAVSHDGEWIAFTQNGIHVVRLGSASRRLTDSGKNVDTHPSWSPDGSRIVFARREGDGDASQVGLYVVFRDGSGLRRLTRHDDDSPSWSPGGNTIAYTRWRGYGGLERDVRRMDPDGTHSRLLARNAANPSWSPDGSRIAVVQELRFRLAVVDVRTRRARGVTASPLFPEFPAWSPDGRRIAFEDYSDVHSDNAWVGIPEIYVVGADGSGLRRLTRNEAADWSPAWLRGGRIVFASDRAGPVRLYVMNDDGIGVHRLATGPDDDGG
jgi:Tol biopolymer transport system component